MNHLTVDVFLERVREMPDIEAKEQIEMRREGLSLQYNLLLTARQELAPFVARDSRDRAEYRRLGVELVTIGYDMGVLRVALKEINARMDRVNWAKAVTALYGQEGFNACRMWMAAAERPAA